MTRNNVTPIRHRFSNTETFEGFAGRRIGVEPKPKAAGGPWIRVGIGGQDIYLEPEVARSVALSLATAANEVSA